MEDTAILDREVQTLRRSKMRVAAVENALESLKQYLLGQQAPEGYWCSELGCDVTTTADYILLQHFLNRNVQSAGKTAAQGRVQKAARRILNQQNADGSWSIYHGGPGEISATVKAYFALKLAGVGRDNERMRSSAAFIHSHGGVGSVNSFLKFYLALFGQWPWARVPAMPPELFLLPKSLPFNIYAMSSWSRAIVVPMFILFALKPKISVPVSMGISELTFLPRRRLSPGSLKNDAWSKFFYRMDYLLKGVEKNPLMPWREGALVRCREWIVERIPKGQGLGSIWPAMINAQMALSCLEFENKEEIIKISMEEIEDLIIEDGETLRVQPCFSSVWDTAIAVLALHAAGVQGDDPRMKQAGEWLLSKEVRLEGDWKEANPQGCAGGWYFQFANEYYPDTDDTAMVLLALDKIDLGSKKEPAVKRALQWLRTMQGDDGGWGAFDKNNNRVFLTRVPFADHNAMIDPSTSDVTGRILEAFGTLGGFFPDAAGRAFAFLRANQESDGTWFGRWGVNYIYGTWAVSNAVRSWAGRWTGVDLKPALDWLRSHQNPDGGWGESCASYDDPKRKGRGPSTASQTAWALLTFFNAGVYQDSVVENGIAYLVKKIKPSGAVEEPEFTGTGFPCVYYLNYHSYRINFPLIALGRYRDYFENHPSI